MLREYCAEDSKTARCTEFMASTRCATIPNFLWIQNWFISDRLSRMPNSMVSSDLPAESAAFERRNLFRYSFVIGVSAALHFAVWHFRDVLEQRPEPTVKPVPVIEVTLTPVPLSAPAAKGPEPGPEKTQAKKAEHKPIEPKPPVVAKPPPRPKPPPPKPEPKPKPPPKRVVETDPNPIREVRPEPRPVAPPREVERPAPARSEVPPTRAAEAPSARVSRPTEDAEGSSALRSRGGELGKVGGSQGRADEGPTTKAGYLHNPRPEYPALAKHRQLEGRVVLRIKVLADGRIGEASVHASSGHTLLDEAALEQVRSSWRFKPAMRGGKPVESWVNAPINFKLE